MLSKTWLGLSALLGAVSAVPTTDLEHRSSWGKQTGVQYDMPMTWNPLGFLSKVSLGTPKKEITVFVDWTWVDLLVMTPRCNGTYNYTSCLFPSQITWDPRNSTTYKDLETTYDDFTWRPNHFFFQYPMHVTIGSDSVQVGSVTKTATLQFTDLTFNAQILGEPFPFSGIFGLSPVFKGDQVDYQSAFFQLREQGGFQHGQAGFVYCYNNATKASTCNGHDGIQTVGGYRTDLIKNDKIYWYSVSFFPDVNKLDFIYDPPVYNYWGIELEGLWIGDEEQTIEATSSTSGKGAIFDHASYGRGAALTPNAYQKLVSLTGGKSVTPKSPPNNGPQSFYSVDCSKTSSFPELKYQFVGQDRQWVITPEHYVATLDDGSCVLNIRALASGDKFIGNFGETFAKDKYVILDWDNLRVGLADVKWSGSC